MNFNRILTMAGVTVATMFVVNQMAAQGGMFRNLFRPPNND